VGKKRNKVWFICAYHRESGKIMTYIWGMVGIEKGTTPGQSIGYGGISEDLLFLEEIIQPPESV
jgi:hypothetical protein